MSRKKNKPSRKERRRQKALQQEKSAKETISEPAKIDEINDGWQDFELDESLFLCPKCQSDQIVAINGAQMQCQSCQELFKADFYPKEPDKTAMALYLKARKELEKIETLPKSSPVRTSALEEIEALLAGAISKLEKQINLKKARAGSLAKLAEMYELYASLLLDKDEPVIRQALAQAKKAKTYLERSEKEEKISLSPEVQGRVHDHLAFCLQESHEVKKAWIEHRKAIRLFDQLLQSARQSDDSEKQAQYILVLMKNLWLLASTLLEKGEFRQALMYYNRLLELLEQAKALFPENQFEIEGGFWAIYINLFVMTTSSKDIKLRSLIKTCEEKVNAYEEKYENSSALIAFLLWLKAISPQETQAMETDFNQILAARRLEKKTMLHPLDWHGLDEKERAHHLEKVQRLHEEFYTDFLNSASPDEIEDFVQESTESIQQIAYNPQADQESISIAFQAISAARLFKERGYRAEARILLEEAARIIEDFIYVHEADVFYEKNTLMEIYASLLSEGQDQDSFDQSTKRAETADKLYQLLLDHQENELQPTPADLSAKAAKALVSYFGSVQEFEKAREISDRFEMELEISSMEKQR